ncbi:MAG: hypothetical protein HRU20_10165 [Pseudomonadales bacterium]|nr:hypothetical protein [Pseudomonadales bacterium]
MKRTILALSVSLASMAALASDYEYSVEASAQDIRFDNSVEALDLKDNTGGSLKFKVENDNSFYSLEYGKTDATTRSAATDSGYPVDPDFGMAPPGADPGFDLTPPSPVDPDYGFTPAFDPDYGVELADTRNIETETLEALAGYKFLNNDDITLSVIGGLRQYRSEINSVIAGGKFTTENWTEVVMGVQGDYHWADRNTLSASHLESVNGASQVSKIENKYTFDSGMSLGAGYKLHSYELEGDSGLEMKEKGVYISAGFTF